jgi:hypothetical protein
MTEEKKELQAEYKDLYDKNPSNAWNEDKLKELIEAKKDSPEEEEYEVDPNKTYTFELQGEYAEMNRVQIQPEVSTMCAVTQKRRMLRLCQYEDSQFLDSQEDDAKPYDMPITITRGSVSIDGKDAFKIKFLLASDYIFGKKSILRENESSKNMFKLKDEQKVQQRVRNFRS